MKTLLFVDDDHDILAALVTQAEARGYRVLSAHNTFTAVSLIQREDPDLICIDVNMPTGNGLGIAELMMDLGKSDLPMIVLSGQSDLDTLRRCHDLGAPHVTKGAGQSAWSSIEPLIQQLLDESPHGEASKPPSQPLIEDLAPTGGETDEASDSKAAKTDPNRDLIETVFEMLGADADFLNEESGSSIKICSLDPSAASDDDSPSLCSAEGGQWTESQPWVLCIEDDEDFSLALKLKLQAKGIRVMRANEGVQGVNQASTRPADAIILDFNLPNGQGDFVLRRLKSNPATASIPVIVLTGVRDQNLGHKMMSLGASKFMNKPVVWEELFAELDRHLNWATT